MHVHKRTTFTSPHRLKTTTKHKGILGTFHWWSNKTIIWKFLEKQRTPNGSMTHDEMYYYNGYKYDDTQKQ